MALMRALIEAASIGSPNAVPDEGGNQRSSGTCPMRFYLMREAIRGHQVPVPCASI